MAAEADVAIEMIVGPEYVTGSSTLTVTAEGHDDYEATAEFTDGTANHSLMVVNVKMSTTIEFGEMHRLSLV